MRYNQLGRTGLLVSEICLGTMTFGSGGQFKIGELKQDVVDKVVARSLEAGVNFIDTADVYAAGNSERLTGQALKNLGVKRSDVVVATKVHGKAGNGPNDRGASRAHIMDGVKGSLERLQLDHIDLYQIHGLDPITPVDETLRALDDLVREGLVRYIGVSNWPAWQIMKALGSSEKNGWARFDSLQAYYTLAGRDLEREIVPLLKDQKVGLMIWSPLAGGLLSGKYEPNKPSPEGARRAGFQFPPVDDERAWRVVDAMRVIAKAHNVSVAQIALAWLLHQNVVTSIIIGVRKLEQLEDNLGAVDVALSAEELKTLDKASALPPEYPGWMLVRQSEGRVPPPRR